MTRRLPWINPGDAFPPTTEAFTLDEGANGLLAAGADLSAARLKQAYGLGIFPWFSEGEPVLWWTPNPRMVLMLDEFKISTSFRKTIRRAAHDAEVEIIADADFVQTMHACGAPRAAQSGTWINPMMIEAYQGLHRIGLAHSVEVRRSGTVVGGLYCVSVGRMVFGESMFSRETDASKLALAALVAWMRRHGGLVIDCQQRTQHLASLGGREISRSAFESLITPLVKDATLPWSTKPMTRAVLGDLA